MSGIKISELNKWSISDVEDVDPKDILIPVSINAITGCLRSNTLINFLKSVPSDIDAQQNESIDDLRERVAYLSSTLESFITEVNRKYNNLIYNQTGIDVNQTSQINQNTQDINIINSVNNEQSAQINAMSEWEVVNNPNG